MPIIEANNLYKHYTEGTDVLQDVSFSLEEGELVVLVGASGCGKTTLLKMINKLIPVSDGVIRVHGKKLSDWNTIELRRSIGYVIQQTGLYPHMKIDRNIGFVPFVKGIKKSVWKEKARELIRLVGLDESYLKRYPRELSGGEAQRVGVARALAADPDIILMDEPFGAVDEITRKKLQDELKSLHKKLKKTILFVTHDIDEALKLGDRILLFNKGKIEQIGTPEELVFAPKTEYVRQFFGVKGFKASLDEEKLKTIYDKILEGKVDRDQMFKT